MNKNTKKFLYYLGIVCIILGSITILSSLINGNFISNYGFTSLYSIYANVAYILGETFFLIIGIILVKKFK